MAMIQSFPTGSGNGTSKISQKLGNAATNITGSTNPAEDGLYVFDYGPMIDKIQGKKFSGLDKGYYFLVGVARPGNSWNINTSLISFIKALGTSGCIEKGDINIDSNGYAILTEGVWSLTAGTINNSPNAIEYVWKDSNGNTLGNTGYVEPGTTSDTDIDANAIVEVEAGQTLAVAPIRTLLSGSIEENYTFVKIHRVGTTEIDPVAYLSKDGNLEETPVGSIISYMGNNVPKHYLPCDGSIYNIADYPELALHIKNEFGTYNYFGGDGITTFAVPDRDSKIYSSIITPATSATGSDYTIISSGEHSLGMLNAWKAFDNNLSTNYTSNMSSPSYIGIVFNKTKEINCYKLVSRNFDNNDIQVFPNEFILQGTNDGTTWVDIDTQKGVSVSSKKEEVMFTLPKAVFYKGYRLYMTKNNGYQDPYFGLSEFNLYRIKEASYIKYETTHKVFFGDQTTYKVSVPITYNFPQTPQMVWAEFDTANAEDDISMLGSSSIILQGDAFVAPMDGYYHATFMFPEQADIPGTGVTYHSTYVYKNGIVIGGSDRQDNSTNIRVPLNESFTLKLKKGDTINVGVYMSGQTTAFTRNGQATFCLVNTLNENKVLELMNKPNLWVVGQEYNFGDGVYGQRFTGNVAHTGKGTRDVNLISGIANMISSGGYWDRGVNKTKVPVNASIIDSGATSGVIAISCTLNQINSDLTVRFLNNSAGTSTYDIWVKYTK